MQDQIVEQEYGTDAASIWQAIVGRARRRQGASGLGGTLGTLFDPILDGASAGTHVVAHLGQSLDGRIALVDGRSRFVTGSQDITHNHRLRALCHAVIIGAGTAETDDPRLTVRHVDGDNPVRVVLDPALRLDPGLGVFCDRAAPTLVVCAASAAGDASRHGDAEIVGLAQGKEHWLPPGAVIDALAERGLTSLFIEGGGVTVSHFIEAGLVDRLHITVAPILLGDGRPVLTLASIERLDAARRLSMRAVELGDDLLYDCVFHDAV